MKTITGSDIEAAARLLNEGEVVAVPTETVYGLAGNALNTDAVLKIYGTKNRPSFNPLIVHVKDAGEFEKYAKDIPPVVYGLAEKFSPGPLTFVLPKKEIIPDIVTGGGDSVALRVPGHPLTQKLLRRIGFPLAAPSANPSGYISPVTARHVEEQLSGKIPYILDGGRCEVGVESTVIAFNEKEEPLILRPGGISFEQIAEVCSVVHPYKSTGDHRSPGQLKSHYAPGIPLHFGKMEELLEKYAAERKAVLSFTQAYTAGNIIAQEILSPAADLHEAARNLFPAMRKLDASGAEVILAEKLPGEGLGVAINDRLERAAVKEDKADPGSNK